MFGKKGLTGMAAAGLAVLVGGVLLASLGVAGDEDLPTGAPGLGRVATTVALVADGRTPGGDDYKVYLSTGEDDACIEIVSGDARGESCSRYPTSENPLIVARNSVGGDEMVVVGLARPGVRELRVHDAPSSTAIAEVERVAHHEIVLGHTAVEVPGIAESSPGADAPLPPPPFEVSALDADGRTVAQSTVGVAAPER